MITIQGLLERFLNNEFEQLFCEKCMNTFLTNIYDLGDYVILEKYALGLEYFRDAIKQQSLNCIPKMAYLGVLDGMTNERLDEGAIELFTHKETHYRLIYVMEKLKHLPEADEKFFTEQVHALDWLDETQRHTILNWIEAKYGVALAQDIRKLCRYYRQHSDYIGWDLHGDNLMLRPDTQEIVILDPFTLRSADYSLN